MAIDWPLASDSIQSLSPCPDTWKLEHIICIVAAWTVDSRYPQVSSTQRLKTHR